MRDGDMIVLDVGARRLDLDVEPPSSRAPRRDSGATPQPPRSAYGELYQSTYPGPPGCDFDFVLPGHDVPEPEIY